MRKVLTKTGHATEAAVPAETYVAYPRALQEFGRRLGATAEEIAAWVFYGPSLGGLAAYLNANELDPPPLFSFALFDSIDDAPDYLATLMGTWFKSSDVAGFRPKERYMSGKCLIERWSAWPGLVPEAFIRAKIRESRLSDLHPICGLTEGTTGDRSSPPLDQGLFAMSEVQAIELEDIGEPRKRTPSKVAKVSLDSRWPPAMPAAANESSIVRARRLQARKKELKAQGNRRFLQQIATEEGLSVSRVKQVISRAADQGPFNGLVETVSRDTRLRTRKGKR